MIFKHQIPHFYGKILPSSILQISMNETKATCGACAMSRPAHRGKTHYQPDLKCCTFHPFLPNFLVGAILQDESLAAGANVLRDKIARREYALPIGMVAPVRYQLDFHLKKAAGEFGQNVDLLCPYYDREQQNCRVWRYRGVVCTTFFCKSSFGQPGKDFWDEMSDYLAFVEMALMEEALVLLDFSPRQVSHLVGFLNRESGTVREKKSWVLPADRFRELWNGYEDFEAFYKKTFEIAVNLDKKSFRELMGETGVNLQNRVLASYSQIAR